MKKTYSKPEIMFESFTLSVNIAGDCEVRNDTLSKGSCAYTYIDEFLGAVNVFTADLEGICTTREADGEYNGICYHTPSDSLFNS